MFWFSAMMLACTQGEGSVGLNEFALIGVAEDDQGEQSAWGELYNGDSVDLSIEGWTFTYADTSWVAPDIVVPAGGTAVLWMDGEPEQSAAHTAFELTEEGGPIDVTDADGELIQSVVIPMLETGSSFGRRPDGAANWQVIDDPSPGALNGG